MIWYITYISVMFIMYNNTFIELDSQSETATFHRVIRIVIRILDLPQNVADCSLAQDTPPVKVQCKPVRSGS